MSKKADMYSFPLRDYETEGESNAKSGKKEEKGVKASYIQSIPVTEMHDFREHPFHVEYNESMYELIDSIGREGVIVPVLVRSNPYGEGYELISGHRRKKACVTLGIKEMPAVVCDYDDEQAVIAMVDSNLQRESLKPSEKAYAYKMKLEAIKQQGKRKDLTSSQVGTDEALTVRSDEELAKQTGESRMAIQRYIRLTNLLPEILEMVDEEKIAFTIAVELSFLSEDEQRKLHTIMEMEQCTPSLSQANRMKRMSQSGELNMERMSRILEQEKPNQREQIKIRADRLNRYFPNDYTPNQKVELIENLVKEWYERQKKVQVKQIDLECEKSRYR